MLGVVQVRRAFRSIDEVVSAEVLADKRAFRLVFVDKEERCYEAETRVDCAQIVAKINFLIQEKRGAAPKAT